MRSIAIVILAALLAAFGAACMGDDGGEQSRRPAALGETLPEDPEEPTTPTVGPKTQKLSLTVVHGVNASGYATPLTFVIYGHLAVRTPLIDCVSAAEPGRTCTWEYVPDCPVDTPSCSLTTYLSAYPPAGVTVFWTGCSSNTNPVMCKVVMSPDKSVKATFIHTSVRKLSLTVVDQINHITSVSADPAVRYGRKTGGSWIDYCLSAAAPGHTCTWEYSQNACPVETPNCTVEVRLSSYPPAGARVVWTGCSSSFTSSGKSVCVVELPGDRSVKATIER